MIVTLLGLIFFLIIVGVIWWGLQQLLALVPLAEPFRTIIVIYVATILLSMAGVHVNTFRLS